MGEVYRARDTQARTRSRASKCSLTASTADADRVARFTREAKALAALNHPHIAAHLRLRGKQRRATCW